MRNELDLVWWVCEETFRKVLGMETTSGLKGYPDQLIDVSDASSTRLRIEHGEDSKVKIHVQLQAKIAAGPAAIFFRPFSLVAVKKGQR